METSDSGAPMLLYNILEKCKASYRIDHSYCTAFGRIITFIDSAIKMTEMRLHTFSFATDTFGSPATTQKCLLCYRKVDNHSKRYCAQQGICLCATCAKTGTLYLHCAKIQSLSLALLPRRSEPHYPWHLTRRSMRLCSNFFLPRVAKIFQLSVLLA